MYREFEDLRTAHRLVDRFPENCGVTRESGAFSVRAVDLRAVLKAQCIDLRAGLIRLIGFRFAYNSNKWHRYSVNVFHAPRCLHFYVFQLCLWSRLLGPFTSMTLARTQIVYSATSVSAQT
jgi:hypothetical protein